MEEKTLAAAVRAALERRYGASVPREVSDRLKEEWDFLTGSGREQDLARAYAITCQLRRRHIPWIVSGADGGGCLAAFLLGITQVDPLAPHYDCPRCRTVEFAPGANSGLELPAKTCATCGGELVAGGHKIPFAWFVHSARSTPLPLFGTYQVPDGAAAILEECAARCNLPVVWGEAPWLEEEHISLVPTVPLGQLHWLCRETGLEWETVPTCDAGALRAFWSTMGEGAAAQPLWHLGGWYRTVDEGYALPPDLWGVFSDRESLFDSVCRCGCPAQTAFALAQAIRKGRGRTPEVQEMLKAARGDPGIAQAAKHIRYLPSRVQTISAGLLYLRLAWFRLRYPEEYRQAVGLFF